MSNCLIFFFLWKFEEYVKFIIIVTDWLFHWIIRCRLGRLQDSNAVLSHFNEFSEHCFAAVSGDLSRNTRLLNSMKSDLDYIFQKIRYGGDQLFWVTHKFFSLLFMILGVASVLPYQMFCLLKYMIKWWEMDDNILLSKRMRWINVF